MEFVAAELGVDRKTLERRCEAAGFFPNGSGLRFRDAYDALTRRSEVTAAADRQKIVAANDAEFEFEKKKNMFIMRSDHATKVKDLSTRTRLTVERASYIKREFRERLIGELSESVK